jgi:superfamily II DNA or RNA helicase
MPFATGSLVKARGREWVVLPESTDDLLVLRPLGGTDDETTGVYLPLEKVEAAQFDLPSPADIGDYRSCRLLRDAVRLGFRTSAGPFRSFARLAVEPRPYQLVPLLMALRLDPVRLLIADDVGVGKTIEALLVARELLDRGDAKRLAVLCPPHLAEQWQAELRDKFLIDAELVLASTVRRLESACTAVGQSIFDVHPNVIVSVDFIKADRRRDDFLRTCPDLVIVDEAHTCAYGFEGKGGRHQRNQLLRGLASKADRHMILVTGTPHSGHEDAFRSLLGLLKPEFSQLPDDLTGADKEHQRRAIAAHFIQRRRADIRHYLDADTPFPERKEAEETYQLSPDYKKLFERVVAYARETVATDAGGRAFRQRVRWWSALALLRSLASSPAAAAATLRNRAATADSETVDAADEIGRRTVLDLEDEQGLEDMDITPGADAGEHAENPDSNKRRLLEMARQADALCGDQDEKLKKAVKLVSQLVRDGCRPIVFCRFIHTADYVAQELRKKLPGKVEVAAVTGVLPPEEREQRVLQLADNPQRVLVCTDCLSEGINLQEHFDAVLHYDLSWNPTRHEQREGRVDRYGQVKSTVRVVTYYGTDNQIDGIVLEVLIRKHKTIRSSLGISVPVPADTNQVLEAIFEGLLLRESGSPTGPLLPGFEDYLKPQKEDLFGKWENVSEKEKRSRTMFAQYAIKVDEVTRELTEVRSAIGSGVDVASFLREAVSAHGGVVSGDGTAKFDISETPRALRDVLGDRKTFAAKFELPVPEGTLHLHRTHPLVEALAGYVMATALDPQMESVARRAGVIRSRAVERRTTLFLVRFRFHIIRKDRDNEVPLLAEDCQLLAFEGSPQSAQWLDRQQAEALLTVKPDSNTPLDVAQHHISRILDDFGAVRDHFDDVASQRGRELLESHRRVRKAIDWRGVSYRVEPKLPPDILGVYVFLPASNP